LARAFLCAAPPPGLQHTALGHQTTRLSHPSKRDRPSRSFRRLLIHRTSGELPVPAGWTQLFSFCPSQYRGGGRSDAPGNGAMSVVSPATRTSRVHAATSVPPSSRGLYRSCAVDRLALWALTVSTIDARRSRRRGAEQAGTQRRCSRARHEPPGTRNVIRGVPLASLRHWVISGSTSLARFRSDSCQPR
jgi:hypothetical protein